MARIPLPFPGFTTAGVMLALLFIVFFPLVAGAPSAGLENSVGLAPGLADAGARSVHVSRDVNMNTSIESYYCTASTFYDVTSNASPLKADCATMVHNIVSGGDWTFTAHYQHQLIQYGTCAFGVETVGDDVPLGELITMSSLDIQYYVNRSINDFAHSRDRIGSWGESQCPVKLQTSMNDHVMWWVKWGVYGNSK